MRTNTRGFTLIELLAVLCIMALLGAVVVTSVRNLLVGQRLSSATRWVATTAGQARGRSLAERRAYVLCFSFNAEGGRAELFEAAESGDKGEKKGGPWTLDERFTFFRQGDTEGTRDVTFYPDGTLSLDPDATSLAFDSDPAGSHDLGLREIAGDRVVYFDFVRPTGRVRSVRGSE